MLPEWTWEQWQWKGAPYSPRRQHYWDLIIRLFSVISRTLDGGGLTQSVYSTAQADWANIWFSIKPFVFPVSLFCQHHSRRWSTDENILGVTKGRWEIKRWKRERKKERMKEYKTGWKERKFCQNFLLLFLFFFCLFSFLLSWNNMWKYNEWKTFFRTWQIKNGCLMN